LVLEFTIKFLLKFFSIILFKFLIFFRINELLIESYKSAFVSESTVMMLDRSSRFAFNQVPARAGLYSLKKTPTLKSVGENT